MARNVEIKARTRDGRALLESARALSDVPVRVIEQRDTFFAIADGRLKLREFADGSGELIAYRRDDASEPTASDYEVCAVADAARLRETLASVPGVRGEVVKRRHLLEIGRTRVHVDDVEGLGRFVELEVVLAEDEAVAAGIAEAESLMRALGIARRDLVESAYIDLIESSAARS